MKPQHEHYFTGGWGVWSPLGLGIRSREGITDLLRPGFGRNVVSPFLLVWPIGAGPSSVGRPGNFGGVLLLGPWPSRCGLPGNASGGSVETGGLFCCRESLASAALGPAMCCTENRW